MKKKLVLSVLLFALLLSSAAYAGAETETETEEDYNPYFVLVNKTHKLPEGWENVVDIITVENSLGEELQIEQKTYDAYCALRNELLDEYDIQIELDSVYRSVEEQQEIWDDWSADPEKGEDYCKKYLAVPGYSEHHTGLAVDIFIMKDGKEIRENDDMIADTDDFAIIHQLLPRYGFILRYPDNKDYVTGYAYEPWHLRYIDDTLLANAITATGIAFEECFDEIS